MLEKKELLLNSHWCVEEQAETSITTSSTTSPTSSPLMLPSVLTLYEPGFRGGGGYELEPRDKIKK